MESDPTFMCELLDGLQLAGRWRLAADLGVSDQTIYKRRRQDTIDRGLEPGPTSEEQAELRAARRLIAELETELAARVELWKDI